MSAMAVRYYKITASPRNAGIVMAFGEWPARILRHRGWNDLVAIRSATDDEQEVIGASMRYQAWRWQTIGDLLRDHAHLDSANLADLEASLRAACADIRAYRTQQQMRLDLDAA